MAEEPKKHSPVLFVAAGCFLSYFLYTRIALYLARRRMKKEHGCKPCPHRLNKDPIFGLDVIYDTLKNAKEHAFLPRAINRFKKMNCKTFLSRGMNVPLIITIEPENIKTILSLKFKDYGFSHRGDSFTPLLGHGIFNSDGERWANSRHLLRPNFAREQVADLGMLERHLKIMLKLIPRDGSTVDLQELFFRLTIDTATEFLFNHSTNSLRMVGKPDSEEEDIVFAKSFNLAQGDVLNKARLGPLKFLSRDPEAEKARNFCHAYVDKWVNEAVRWREEKDAEKAVGSVQEEERYVFIHELAKQTTDKKRIREELINVLLAGRDTTASLLSNMFVEITKNPEIWAKLREEVAQLDGRLPTYEELRNLKYVKYCLNESLRLHPVVPNNSRCAERDTVLPLGGGPEGKDSLFVPKGTIVGYTTFTMHRREDYYGPDSYEFRPERWETLRPGWEYLPFNGGPRICLGQQYALTEASYVTVRLIQEFKEIESRHPGPWEESLTLTVCSRHGAPVAIKA